jgi:peptidyl-prolyl cis-trans isomerase C
MRTKSKPRPLCLILFFAVFGFAHLSTAQKTLEPGDHIAIVGDTPISTKQYEDALKALGAQGESVASNPELRRKFVDHLVNSKLVAQKARQEGFEKDQRFQDRLKDMTEQLLAGEYMDRTLDKQLTESAVRRYFDDHKLAFSKREVKASHILVPTEDEAKALLAEIKKNPDSFDAVAKRASKDQTVDMGFFKRGRMVKPFEEAAFATAKGAVHSKPIHTPFGWHVIKVTDSRGDDKVDYKEFREQARSKLRTERQETLVTQLRESTKVVLNDKKIKEFKLP